MKKRLCACLLAVCLMVALLPVTAAAIVASGECGKQGNNLTWTLDDAGTLTIRGSGAMINYENPFSSLSSPDLEPWPTMSVKTVVIEAEVTSIGNYAFANCIYLSSVTIPDSVTSIGSGAFRGCNSLINITIPNSVTSIGNSAFYQSKGLANITLSDKVASIEPMVFSGCTSLTSVAIPDSVTSIGTMAFSECTSLTSVTIPANVTSIGGEAFRGCSGLTSAGVLGSNCNYQFGWTDMIPANAFSCCYGLTSVILPDSVTSIGNYALYGCSNLTSISIPNSVTSIGEFAFYNCSGLTSVTIPDNVTSIAVWTFHGCSSLSDVTIPKSVIRIDTCSFYNCDSLSDVYYTGSEPQWANIQISGFNEPLTSAAIHYNSILPTEPSGAMKLEDGVKYVPYNSRVEDYKIASDASIHYKLEGTLPSGLSLDPATSMISGVPMADGTWNFTLQRMLPNGVKDIPCTLTILSNTDAAVQRPNDYPIIIPVGTPDRNDSNHFYKNEYTEETLKINGPFDEFYRLLIDGRQLTQPDDYTVEEGSTVITIHTETFQRFGEGTHTIAAEFRPSNNPSQVKRVAQNYTLRRSNPSSGGNGSGGRSKPSINKNAQKPQPPQGQQQAIPFADVAATEWYYEDVVWAYQEGLMQGVDGAHFGPDEKVSQATIVTVLARLAKIDLSQFNGETEPNVPAGQYYTAAAIWAKRAGLMPSGGAFTGSEVTTRNEMAVMLTKYLASMGKDTTPPAQTVTFEDAAGMSQEGNNAFQVLYQHGIFRGTGGLKMEPDGSTTRAQFVALMHRVYDTAVG